MSQPPSIDRLLNLVPDLPETVLAQLQAYPDLSSKQDAHGYSLVHAAASYAHAELLRALIKDFNVDPNIKDEDGETALFSVEEVPMAQLLLELGTDMTLRNAEGQTAAEKLDDEDEQPEIAAFLRQRAGGSPVTGESAETDSDGTTQRIPPLPEGVRINVGTMPVDDVGEAPDPEFRRRIEELAAREDFDREEAQQELRNLITDAVSGLAGEGQGSTRKQRRE
ncbi:uncharacterized protein K489DRAFT_376480 [Dissoconium aciculare CBS 342.82]|uniref:Ankyrin repeat protein n=1 Tax=Dissoconium aciculare CBS 342.82 TaxID=1314786 RepID=A0A6J3MGQ8_9PEZI|nr:uncharacterized protein K489DRAFT_376480 [Dissoconium aciculare CBS 342.82]KAF1826082.1 hypothetical protein K489DRAFT_376480 [Dissoconium aciculare CBS 342.82]